MAAYNEIETSKTEKHKHKFFKKLLYIALTLLLSFVTLSILGYNNNQIFIRDVAEDLYMLSVFFKDVINFVLFIYNFCADSIVYFSNVLNGNGAFNFQDLTNHWAFLSEKNYFIPSPPQTLLDKGYYNFQQSGSHIVYMIFLYIFMFSSLYFMFYGKKRTYKKYLYYPLSALFFGALTKSDSDKFLFAGNWSENFKSLFFKRHVEISDGYQRVPFLEYWARYPQILSGEPVNNKYKYALHFLFIRHLFLNDEELDDLFHIVEGYMCEHKKNPKSIINEIKQELGFHISAEKTGYNKPNYFDKYIEIKKEELSKYRCFNGRDEVTFSVSAITFFLDRETKLFEDMLETKGSRGRNSLARNIFAYIANFEINPSLNTKILFGINNHKNQPMDFDVKWHNEFIANPTKEAIAKRLRFVLISYFRFVLLREVILSYMNLPAGTIVVKIDDYTLRMIIDSYASQSFVQIDKGKNDGTNNQFQNDSLANMFFYAYWYYSELHDKTTLQERIAYHFNTNILNFEDQILNDTIETETQEMLKRATKIDETI